MASLYKMPLTKLSGVGVKRAELFAKLGINSVGELLNFYPRAYEDWTDIKSISDVNIGEICCIKATLGTPVNDSYSRGGTILSKGMVFDDTGSLRILFFNNRYISGLLKVGEEYLFRGKINDEGYGLQMLAPVFSPSSEENGLHAIYKQTPGLVSKVISNCVKQALTLLPKQINDPLPEQVRKTFSLCGLREALEQIHFPKDPEKLYDARKRLVTEELLVLNLGMKKLKEHSRGVSGVKISADYSDDFKSTSPICLQNHHR